MENQLAQLTNYLPVLGVIIVSLVLIGLFMGVLTTLMRMEPKKRLSTIMNFALLILVIVIAGTGALVMRDSIRDESLIACQKQGINYTIQDWDNGLVNLTKCNITMVNGLT